MTPRITKEGNSVTVAEPSEYERLCEALANAIFANELMLFSQRTYMEAMAVQLNEVGHPAAARAIREGIERAKEKELPSQVFDNYALSGRTVAVYLGPRGETPPPDCRWRVYKVPDWYFDYTPITPPPEDLSALKKRIGFVPSSAKEVLRGNAGGYLSGAFGWCLTPQGDDYWRDIFRKSLRSPEPYELPDEARQFIQALLDHEDDPDQSEETV